MGYPIIRNNLSRTQFDLSLYLVLDPELCGGIAGMVSTVYEAVERGVTCVQLRSEKEVNKRYWYDAGMMLKALLADYNVPLIVNDHIDVALAIDADGVHIGQNDLPADVARKILGPNKILGLSVGSVYELNQVKLHDVDYVGVGPVFSTATKKDARPALGVDELQRIVMARNIPKVAIGGINQTNAASVLATGVDGIAVVSAICGQEDIAGATKALAHLVAERVTG